MNIIEGEIGKLTKNHHNNTGKLGRKIIDIEEGLPHKASEVICLECYRRWIAIRPTEIKLIDLECPQCSKQGYAIETGEEIDQ